MTISQKIAKELPFFEKLEDIELFLFIVGALSTRLIILRKACELMNTYQTSLLKLLDAANINFSYLDNEDIEPEKKW
ncbi:hypothetical protein ACFL27_09095 [candidate division CSSED10-310 bacterium]|uniref:Uncharacterized protein n=1 Tax=candidate division CSSED10-310 bacterium TaxID=2855610 RepID=A0ABV6YW93_UNCC1